MQRLSRLVKKLLIVLALTVGVAVLWLTYQHASAPKIYDFANVSGPNQATPIQAPVPARLQDYERGGPNRLAILVTDPESDWLGLVRAFKSQGIPFSLTRDPAKALRHQMIFVYPSISGRLLSREAIQGLAKHIRSGGTLLTSDLAGGGLEELFGIRSQVASRERTIIRWTGNGTNPEDRLTRFSSLRAEVKIGSLGIIPTTTQVLGTFEDGSAAAVCRRVGGLACIIGVDIGSMAQRAMNGRSELFSPDFVNTYNPSMDVAIRWIRDLYIQTEDEPYLIGTSPAGYQGSLVLTHDVDFTRSVRNSVVYADAIRKRGVSASFMIQTKYVRDWNDDIFFNDANLPAFKNVMPGMEIGSHSVAHARPFSSFPMGSGDEYYPRYRPFVKTKTVTSGGTVLGELRVSKFLLEQVLHTDSVRSFRPGHLSYPESLPEALAATGYRYSSALTANSTLSHYPFQLSYARSGQGLLKAWEFPVTIEDEKLPRLGDRFDSSVKVIDKIARNGGVAVVLIHPDITGHKLQFEEKLIDRMKGKMWIGSLGAFGDWWSARDMADFDYTGGILSIVAPTRLDQVTIYFPKGSVKSRSLNNLKGVQRVSIR